MGGSNTSTSSTASTDPNVSSTLDKLLSGSNQSLQGIFNAGPSATAPVTGATTTNAQAGELAAANNPAYSSAINGTLGSLGNAAAGNDYGTNDPTYQALRTQAGNDAYTNVAQSYSNSGRFGGGSFNTAAATGVTNALDSLDEQNYLNDKNFQLSSAQALPSLYTGMLAPSATAASVGASQDAATNATNSNGISWLGQLSNILGSGSNIGGQTTTSTTPATPWYQSVLGGLVSLL